MKGAQYFPLPHVVDGKWHDGALWARPEKCKRCQERPCEAAPVGDLQACPWGFNFQRLDAELLVAGFVLESYHPTSQAWKKRRRSVEPVPNKLYDQLVAHRSNLRSDVVRAREAAVTEQKDELLDEEVFRSEYLSQLREEIVRGLSFVHDYKQINSQIIQNINVIIETRYSGADLQDKLPSATQEEQAIYWAGRFLDEKLNVARFLLRPEWLHLREECTKFRVHGMVLKYMRIYEPWYDERRIKMKLIGQSHGEVVANASACGVIPHTLIDNALKYSPNHSRVELYLDDREEGVLFEVSSFGPQILETERQAIFHPFTRGSKAKELSEEGVGYGLYISELVAHDHLGTSIYVEQDYERREVGDRVWTTFGVTFPTIALVARN